MADWTEKYRPTTLSEVRGNDSARDEFAEWARSWDEHRKAVILHGSPGIGKTSAAHALANDVGWDVMELNASDARTSDVIKRIAGEASKSSTLTQAVQGQTERRLIVLDEADNLHQHADRGGARAITDVVKNASQPIVLIANEYYDMSNGLRTACKDIEFRDVQARSIVPVLRDICRREGIEFEAEAIEAIADQTSGDLRSAIKDLQAMAEGREKLTVEDIVSGSRDRTVGIFDFLDSVLKEDDAETALKTAYDVDETPDDLLLWIEDKAPKVYDPDELRIAYDSISRSDVWLGRVRATQNYSYWRYATDEIAAGVAAAKSRTRGGWTRYGGAPYRSSRDKVRDEVARSIAEAAGTSVGTARREILPYLQAMTHHCKDRELTTQMAARYDLDAGEVSFVTGSGKSTNKVQNIVEEAQERREAEIEKHAGGAFLPGESSDDGIDDEDATEGDDEEATGLAAFSGSGAESSDGDGGESDGEADTATASGDTDDGAEAVDEEDDEGPDPVDRAEDAEDDDQQSGLSDFM